MPRTFRRSVNLPILVLRIGMSGALLPVAAPATTATSLASFEGIEEPLVRYAPASGEFRRDDLANITKIGDGTFRMLLRYRSEDWDADRDTANTDRQRAEVKGLGPHQRTGETFDYTTTWRTNPEFVGAGRFCHVFQLKSTDGDSGAPLITISILPGQERAEVRYWSGDAKSATVAREFAWRPGVWQTVRVRVRTSTAHDGEVLASVDGDDFSGVRGIALFRPDATDYRPKWGLYRSVSPGLPIGDDYVEHSEISSKKVGSVEAHDDAMEKTARTLARGSSVRALAWLGAQPASPTRTETIAAIATEWATREPAAAMAWVEELAPTDCRADAMLRVFNRWTDRDFDAVLRWASARAPSDEIDPMLWYFATDTTIRYVAREKALAGAALIAGEELRAQAIGHIVLIWARREPDAAARYVADCTALSDPQKSALAQKISASRR
jgi:hypothetical protein